MSRRKLGSLEDYSRALRNEKGISIGSDYLPWLRVNDVSSYGKSVKIHGNKTNRTHHLLFEIEERFFLQAEYHHYVIDLKIIWVLTTTHYH